MSHTGEAKNLAVVQSMRFDASEALVLKAWRIYGDLLVFSLLKSCRSGF